MNHLGRPDMVYDNRIHFFCHEQTLSNTLDTFIGSGKLYNYRGLSDVTTHLLRKLLASIVFCIFMILPPETQSQDTQFSQFNAAPLHLAPSFAGYTDGSRVVMNYRNQWPQIPGAFVAYSFSLDHYFHKYHSGLGLSLFRDQAGSGKLAVTQGSLAYSFNFRLTSDWVVRPGVEFAYEQRTLDFFRLIFEDQINDDGTINPSGSMANPLDRISYFDAATSVVAYSSKAWGGISFDNLMRPNQSMTSNDISRIPLKTSIFGGYNIKFGGRYNQQDSEAISFAFLYKNQGRFNQLDIGMFWTKSPVFVGVSYRGIPIFKNSENGFFNNDAVVFMGGLRTNNIRIGYSYDFTISRLINNTGGAHEVSLIYEFNQQIPERMRQRPPIWGN